MRPFSCVRRLGMWGGVVVTALLAAVWVGSAWWNLDYVVPQRGMVHSRHGRVELFVASPKVVWRDDTMTIVNGYGIMVSAPPPDRFMWWGSWSTDSFGSHAVVPLWLPALVALIGTIGAWWNEFRAWIRARNNRCPKCNYDRSGLAGGGVCPECGDRPAPSRFAQLTGARLLGCPHSRLRTFSSVFTSMFSSTHEAKEQPQISCRGAV